MRFFFRTKGEHVQQKDKMKGIIDWGGGGGGVVRNNPQSNPN